MNDLISRKRMLNKIREQRKELGDDYDLLQIIEDVEDLPSAQEWIPCVDCEKRCEKWEGLKT